MTSTRNKKNTHERSFTKKFASSNQVSNRHVEVSVATTPVGYPSKGIVDEDFLALRVNQTDSVLVYRD